MAFIMNEKAILNKIKSDVYDLLNKETTGHDYFHIDRVVRITKKIVQHEKSDGFYAVMLAYLHDVGDYKLHDGVDKTQELVTQILNPIIPDKELVQTIVNDIHLIGYKGGMNSSTDKMEIKIVQDADRLDAMGAIGIARAFAYGGSKGRLLHNPDFHAEDYKNIEDYKNSKAPTIQHFYDKLLKLRDQMNTNTGREMAEERHDFMVKFLNQFYSEWENSCYISKLG